MINFKTIEQSQIETVGTFVLEPLESGFGHTVANCLRRVLLSSLDGAAITSVKISGVSHQFSTLPGISEDMIEIILNLKKVRVKLFSDKEAKIRLQASEKGEVKARDIDTLGAGEILNPDQHIASLNTSTSKLNIEMVVEKGKGYVMADESKSSEIGVLPIDALFSPVLSVSYKVEPTRVGRKTNFDKIILEITTDGTLSPADALQEAAKILSGYFKQIYDPTLDKEEPVQNTIANVALKLSVEELELPVRITNALKAVDIDTVEKLVMVPRGQLLKTKNLGVQSLNLITEKLAERGLTLSEA